MISGSLVHLFLNSLTVVGIPFCLLILASGLWRNKVEIQKLSLELLVFTGLISIGTYVSGQIAEPDVRDFTGYSGQLIDAHVEASIVAFWFLEGIAILALCGLVMFKSAAKLPAWFATIMLIGMLVGGGLIANTGYTGELITHPEIRLSTSLPAGPTIISE